MIHSPETAERVARDLLRIGAVALRPDAPFTWASGRLSPVYTDNRLTLAFPDVRRRLCDAFSQAVADARLRADVVAGTATAGIPHAAWLADRLDLPLAYVRSAPKAHGRGNQIEGRVEAGQTVVLVEDLVSTGGSVADAAAALRAAGAEVPLAVAIFSYGLDAAAARLGAAELPTTTLTDLSVLARVARDEGSLSDGDLAALDAWRADPVAWSTARGGAG